MEAHSRLTDSHVHSEWSWDAPHGSLERSCRRAVELGLPGIAFTEHLDHTVWTPVDLPAGDFLATLVSPAGTLTPPRFDAVGYLASLERCRDMFPDLHIMSGLEVGEPHLHRDAVAEVLAFGRFDRVLGSLHCLRLDGGFVEPPGLYRRVAAVEVVRAYLAEVATLVSQCDAFAVLAHVDYPLRYWPAAERPFEVSSAEDEFRHALRLTAESGRALEVNTTIPLHEQILRWWREEGGQEITFGSDAHDPLSVARGFRAAAAMAEAHGFRPGTNPYEPWTRAA